MAMQQTPEEEAEVQAFLEAMKEHRISKGISQRAIAEEMGMTQGNYNRLEKGQYVPRMSTLQTWARALGFKVKFELEQVEVSLDAIDKALAEIGVYPVNGKYEL